jgi:CheY-like chemotaxis protein
MPKIFLSYRRDDSRHITDRIADRLTDHFGRESVFRDVDSIPAGADFRRVIEDAVRRCHVLVAVIGPRWLGITDRQGTRRLDDASDFVRLEIEAAVRRGTPVIPVLVDGATMPSAEDLPPSLQELSFRQGAGVRPDPDFHRDVHRLITALEACQPADPAGHLHIFLAEESSFHQRAAGLILGKQRHTWVVAASGEEVLAALEQEPFDLVLMQVQMGGMDGCETTAAIRRKEQEGGAHVPVIGMTNESDVRERGLAVGMDGCVDRPLSVAGFGEAIRRAGEVNHGKDIVDWKVALFENGGDAELLGEMVKIFLEDCPRRITAIQDAIVRQDAHALYKHAHALKGMTGMLCARQAEAAAVCLERIGREARWADADRAYEVLRAETKRLCGALTYHMRKR